jgi:23S rRNA pseudouridine2605 synthase
MAMTQRPRTPSSKGGRDRIRRDATASPRAKSGKPGFSPGKPRFGPKKADETSDDRFRVRGKGPDRHGSAAPPSPASTPRQGGESEHRRHFPDVHIPSAQRRQDENRIAKVMARAGLCSRREAEDWIAAGRVAVNGGTISSPAINVTARDRVTVDGKPLPRRERTRLFLYHKPAGLLTTNADPEGRPTLFDALPKNLPRLLSVGRLDIGTEGLLLLTNDGGLARELELPETGWVRRYRVRAHGRVSQDDLDRLRDGVTVDRIHYGPIDATLERDQGANVWLSFAIREGKNREVRNVLAHLGLTVNRLIRVEFGPFGLGALPEGGVEEVETGNLRTQLGSRIIGRAGCDFSGPAAQPDAPSREERRDQRHALRERLSDDRRGPRTPVRDREDDRPLRESNGGERRRPAAVARGTRALRERDEQAEEPHGRPRRGHAWRKDDAPLHRTYRGSRRDDLKIADEERPDKRTGLMTDRKGRSVLVERFGRAKEKPESAETPARGRPQRRGPPRDRKSGPRPSRPRFSDERADRGDERGDDREGPSRPRKSGFRTEGRRDGKPGRKPGQRDPRPHGQRTPDPRPSGRPPRKH